MVGVVKGNGVFTFNYEFHEVRIIVNINLINKFIGSRDIKYLDMILFRMRYPGSHDFNQLEDQYNKYLLGENKFVSIKS